MLRREVVGRGRRGDDDEGREENGLSRTSPDGLQMEENRAAHAWGEGVPLGGETWDGCMQDDMVMWREPHPPRLASHLPVWWGPSARRLSSVWRRGAVVWW